MEYDVVLPVYNCEKTIERALNSILNQSSTPRNIIIIDDGSTDSSLKIIQNAIPSFGAEINFVIKSVRNSGAASARNVGIGLCESEYIAFLDADDYWTSEKMKNVLPHVPHSGFAHSSCIVVNKNGDILREISNSKEGSFENLLSGQYQVSGSASSVVVRRNYLEKIGSFDSSLVLGEDLELWLRLSSSGEIIEIKSFDVVILDNEKGVQHKSRSFDPFLEVRDLSRILSKYQPNGEYFNSQIFLGSLIGIVNNSLHNPILLIKLMFKLRNQNFESLPKKGARVIYPKVIKHITSIILKKTGFAPITNIFLRIVKKIRYETRKILRLSKDR